MCAASGKLEGDLVQKIESLKKRKRRNLVVFAELPPRGRPPSGLSLRSARGPGTEQSIYHSHPQLASSQGKEEPP